MKRAQSRHKQVGAAHLPLCGKFSLAIASREHVSGLGALLNDPTMAKWLGGARSRGDLLESIRTEQRHWKQHGFGPWVVVDKNTGVIVGRGGLRWCKVIGKSELELFYAVTPSLWGRGIATALARAALELGFSNPAVDSVVGFTTHANKASQRVLEKLGFHREGEFEHAGLPHVLFRLTKAKFSNPNSTSRTE